jgi:hypothetical protein
MAVDGPLIVDADEIQVDFRAVTRRPRRDAVVSTYLR